MLFRLRGGLGVEQGQEDLFGAIPVAGNQHEGRDKREQFAVITRTVGTEGVSNNAGEHAGGNVLEDELVVGVVAGPVDGVGQVGFIQVAQHGFEGHGHICGKAGAALLNPAVHGRFVSDTGSLSELGTRETVRCNECDEVVAGAVGTVGGLVVGAGKSAGEVGGYHGGSFADLWGELGCTVCDARDRLTGWRIF